jgi:2-C-methyl-D-erythritol 2,4-cyclodiphosphate synthase
MAKMNVRTGLGQDSHRFETAPSGKELRLAGVFFEGEEALEGNSDADVVLHALCNAISGVTGRNVLGAVSDAMSNAGVNDSREYVKEALKSLGSLRLTHVSISLECARPKITPKIGAMREALAELLSLAVLDIGITATSGEGLTAFGRGEGIQALVIVTAVED